MARVEGFTYNGYVVGTAAPTGTTQVVGGRFGWDCDAQESDETDVFACEFIITGSSRGDLETQCAAMRAALRTKNAALSVDWGSTNVATYSPLVAGPTGWDGRPKLSKSTRRTRDVKFTRGFLFRCAVQIPSNYTDPNLSGAAAAGRRTSEVSLHWDAGTRRVVSIKGKFHLVANKLPRAATATAALNNPTGPIDTYCVARLAKIDAAATWTIGFRSESDNNTQTEMVFHREYYETINGRFVATPRIAYLPTRQRMIVIQGTFFRTYSATYSGAATVSAQTNYDHVTNGGYAYAVTQLAALTAAQGGALVPGTDCELIQEETVPNDQGDRIDYTLTFRELLFKQSNSAGTLDDPEIVVDKITYALDFTPLDDSSVPVAGGAGGPNPFKGSPSLDGAAGGKPAGTGAPGSLDKSVVPPDGGNPGERERSGIYPVKPIAIAIHYEAQLKKTVLDARSKWTSVIRPWLIGQWTAELGIGSPAYLIGEHFDESADANTIRASVLAVVLPGDLMAYLLEEAIDDDIGEWNDVALTGTPYEYLTQQEYPERHKFRRHTAFYKTGGSFDPSNLLTQSATPGYRVIRRSVPKIQSKKIGIAGLGIGPQDVTSISFVEELLYVARNVATAPGAGSPPSGAATSAVGNTGGGSTVSPENPGGK